MQTWGKMGATVGVSPLLSHMPWTWHLYLCISRCFCVSPFLCVSLLHHVSRCFCISPSLCVSVLHHVSPCFCISLFLCVSLLHHVSRCPLTGSALALGQ